MLTTGLSIHGISGCCVVLGQWWLQRRKDKVQDMKCFSDGRTETGWVCLVQREVRGESLHGDWKKFHLVSVFYLYGTVIATQVNISPESILPSVIVDSENRLKEANEQWAAWRWVSGTVHLPPCPRCARLAPHHGQGFPCKWSSLFPPKYSTHNVPSSSVK